MKKTLALILLILFAAAFLTACGGNDTPEPTEEPQAEETAPDEAEVAPEEVGDEEESADYEALLGIWLWNDNHQYELTFNLDGTGTRAVESIDWSEKFTWEILYGELVIEAESMAERWSYTVEGNRLHIVSLQATGVEYSYTRMPARVR